MVSVGVVFTGIAIGLTVLSMASYVGMIVAVGHATFIERLPSNTVDFSRSKGLFRTAARIGMYRSQLAKADIDRERLVFTCRGLGYVGDYLIRREGVDGIEVDRTPFGTRLRLQVSGRVSWSVTLWVYDQPEVWVQRLAEAGWLAAANSHR